MELQAALETRYSCREFSPDALTTAEITAVLEAGRLAPTARNLQPQKLFVITKDEDLAKIDACSPCRYGAPVVIVVAYDPQISGQHGEGENAWKYGDVDSTSVLVHMLLKATDLDLATVWVGMYKDELLYEAFPMLQGLCVRALVMLGKPGENGGPCDRHTDRKPLEETVTWL